MKKKSFIVSIIGRPNVGKSSLFNRLMHKSTKAITHDMPGVTRDRHYGLLTLEDWENENQENFHEAILVDTGGFYPEGVEITESSPKADKFFNLMTDHAEMAIDESDLVLLVCDIREGLLPFDESIANYIRSKKKNFVIILNKYDDENLRDEIIQFYALGLDDSDIFPLSAAHGRGVETLREKITKDAKNHSQGSELQSTLQKGIVPRENVISKVAIVGAPNAGKSTLLNELVGAERALVSDVAGTTVDPIEAYFDLYLGQSVENYELKKKIEKVESVEERFDKSLEEFSVSSAGEESETEKEAEKEEPASYWRSIQIVDTAGIRKQRSVKELVESQSVYRALRCISESDIVIHLVDVTKGIGHQDRRLIDIAIEKGKSVIVCLNKIDKMDDILSDEKKKKEWLLDLRAKIAWLDYCDIVLISAKYKKHFKKLKESLKKTILIRNRKISTADLNNALEFLIDKNPVTMDKRRGTKLKVKYASMVKSAPPTFLLFTNRSKNIPDNYRRYLTNGLRREFQLDNTPVHLLFRSAEQNKIKEAKITSSLHSKQL